MGGWGTLGGCVEEMTGWLGGGDGAVWVGGGDDVVWDGGACMGPRERNEAV